MASAGRVVLGAVLCSAVWLGLVAGASAAVSFAPQATYGTGGIALSVAVGDFNGDGKPDLAVANESPSTVSVLLGNGNGTFQTQTPYDAGVQPLSVAVGNFNGDGCPDLAVASEGPGNGSGSVSVLLNKCDGTGTFQSAQTMTMGGRPYSVAVGDFNGDGCPDLAVANFNSNTVSVLPNKCDGTGSFGTATPYNVGSSPASVAVGDFNGDGKTDLAVANQSDGRVSVLLGNGDGTFQGQQTYATGLSPTSVAVGDLNGDGKPDLAVANQSDGTVSVLLGNGGGTFGAQSAYTVGSEPYSVAIGDFNGDGKPDLAVASYGSGAVSVLQGNGNGTFQAQQPFSVGSQPTSVAVGDFNGDGEPDLAVANGFSSDVSVLLGNETGTFLGQTTDAVGSSPDSVAVGDFNSDGRPDLAVANNGSNNVSVLAGDGNGTFHTASTDGVGTSPASVAVGDFNGDGKPDLAVSNEGVSGARGTVSVLLGNGDGTFGAQQTYPVGFVPRGVAVRDFNADGCPDLAIANQSDGTVSVLLNKCDGSGMFHGQQTYNVDHGAYSVAVGDFNGDGCPDLAVANADSSTLSVLLNNCDGSGTFQGMVRYSAGNVPVSVAVGDFNGDGKLDLAVANNISDNVSVLLGNGNGTFQNANNYDVGRTPYSVAVGDFNRDGKPDLAVANQGDSTVSVLQGNGDGSFQGQQTYGVDSGPFSVAVGDFNGDARSDLATANGGSNDVSVLLRSPFSAETPVSSSTPGTGSALIDQLRLAGPAGSGDQLADLYNTTSGPMSVGGWELQGSNGGFATIPEGTVIPAHGHVLLTGLSYGLSSYAPSNGELPSGLFSEPSGGGFRLVAPGGAAIDRVGFAGSPPEFFAGTALSVPKALPTGSFAWIRNFSAGAPDNTSDNKADFSYVATNDNDAAHGSPVLGAPGPADLVSPIVHNDILQSGLLDPSVSASSYPNRIYTRGSPATLVINRTITNCSGLPRNGACVHAQPGFSPLTVTRLRFRITGLTTLHSPGAGSSQAVLKADTSSGEGGMSGANACDRSTAVTGLTLDSPSSSGSGGLGSTWSATLPFGGLGSGQCINVEFEFNVSQGGKFNFAYNAEDDLRGDH
jgi:hypothetical protein